MVVIGLRTMVVETKPAVIDNACPMESANVTNETKRPNPELHLEGDAAVLARGRAVLRAEAEAIVDASSRLGEPFICAVRTLLRSTGRVCVTGVGKAGLIGHKIQATLASTGTLAYSLHPVEALHGDLGMVHADDVIVGLSKSGGSELVQLLPRLKEVGCQVILMTAKLDSKATAYADVVLDIGSTKEACPLGLAPSSSTAAMLALGDALALTVMDLRSVQPEQYAKYHPGGALGRFLMEAREIMRTKGDCPTVSPTANLRECYESIVSAPRRAGAACVVDASGKLVGIVTHGDFFRLFENRDHLEDQTVEEVMTADPKHVRQGQRVVDALRMMRNHSIDELPVVDDQHCLVGLIDIQDLIDRNFSVFDQA